MSIKGIPYSIKAKIKPLYICDNDNCSNTEYGVSFEATFAYPEDIRKAKPESNNLMPIEWQGNGLNQHFCPKCKVK